MFNDTSAVDRVRRGATGSGSDTAKLVNMDVWYATTLWLALLSGWIDPTSGRRTRNNPNGGVIVKPVVPPALLIPPASEEGYYDSGRPGPVISAPNLYDPMSGSANYHRDVRSTGNTARATRSADRYLPPHRPRSRMRHQPSLGLPGTRGGPPLQSIPFPLQMFGGPENPSSPYGNVGPPDPEGNPNVFGQIPAVALFPAQGQRPGSLKNKKDKKDSLDLVYPPIEQSGDLWDQIYTSQPGGLGKNGDMSPLTQQTGPPLTPPDRAMTSGLPNMSPLSSLPYQSMSPPHRRHGAWATTVLDPQMNVPQDMDFPRMKRRSRQRSAARGGNPVSLESIAPNLTPPINLGPVQERKQNSSTEPASLEGFSKRRPASHRGGRHPPHVSSRLASSSEEDDQSEEKHRPRSRSRRRGGKRRQHRRKPIEGDDEDEGTPRRAHHLRQARAMHSSDAEDESEFEGVSLKRKRRRQRISKVEDYPEYPDEIEE